MKLLKKCNFVLLALFIWGLTVLYNGVIVNYFANLFLTKKGIKFKSEDLRHNMSAINTSINGKEVRNIKPLIAVRGIARREIKAKSL